MLYASTKATLKQEFGSGQIKEELHATSVDDMTLSGYRRHKRAAVVPAPLTAAEEELAELRRTEVNTSVSIDTRQQTLSGVAFPLTSEAWQALTSLRDKAYNYVQLRIDLDEETIHLSDTGNVNVAKLPGKVPSDCARYHLYNFKHTHEGDYLETLGGAVVTHWTRIREDPGLIPGQAIPISVSHGFPKSLQANAGMVSNELAVGETLSPTTDLPITGISELIGCPWPKRKYWLPMAQEKVLAAHGPRESMLSDETVNNLFIRDIKHVLFLNLVPTEHHDFSSPGGCYERRSISTRWRQACPDAWRSLRRATELAKKVSTDATKRQLFSATCRDLLQIRSGFEDDRLAYELTSKDKTNFDAAMHSERLYRFDDLFYEITAICNSLEPRKESCQACTHGNPIDWTSFFNLFSALVADNPNLINVERLSYLKSSLSASIMHAPSISPDSPASINGLLSVLDEHIVALRVLDVNVDKWDPLLLHIIKTKLNPFLSNQWELCINEKIAELAKATGFLTFLEGHRQSSELQLATASQPKSRSTILPQKTVPFPVTVISCEHCGQCELFIYSMPGYSCSIKERMLYSSCKGPLTEMIESQIGLPVVKKLEIDSGDELTEEFLQDEIHPKKNLHRPKFSKPKGPPNRGAKRLTKSQQEKD
ncbi:hypothetical protein PR048_029613 [Dryococelus australis]|uniref:ADF-H domain-containing protein n=1 Tax=Dryococelus australis TaxID=614101 RepID=A0ABQ9GDW3_9NEOP|nr:hypothetical protein PR048_029613 [Dryococelus australis]